MYRGALRSVLSELLRQDRLVLTESFTVSAPKTKEAVAKLAEFGVERGLIVVEGFDANVWLSVRNLPHIDVVEASAVDPVSLVAAERVVMTVPAAKILEGRSA